jgi:hypothetical protein
MKLMDFRALFSFLIACCMVTGMRADAIYDVTVDTHLLGSGTAAAFSLVPGGAPVTNMATISAIAFGGGSAGSSCPSSVQPCAQNATGDLSATIVLDDANGFSQFVETFTPGLMLSFALDLTTNAPASASLFPDQFGFTLLDSNGNPLPVADPATGNYFSVQINSATPTVTLFTSAASVQTPSNSVPEPGWMVVSGLGLAGVWIRFGKRRDTYRQQDARSN